MTLVDPLKYFEDHHLEESQTIKACFDCTAETVELVFRYAAEVVGAWFEARAKGMTLEEFGTRPADFRRLVFRGVKK